MVDAISYRPKCCCVTFVWGNTVKAGRYPETSLHLPVAAPARDALGTDDVAAAPREAPRLLPPRRFPSGRGSGGTRCRTPPQTRATQVPAVRWEMQWCQAQAG